MKNLTIDGEPYMYFQVTKNLLVYPYLSSDYYTVVNPGKYILLDRWFRLLIADEKQMEKLIKQDFNRFRRQDGKA